MMTLSKPQSALLEGMTDKQKQAILREVQQMKMDKARDGLIDFCKFIDPQAAHWYKAKHLATIAHELELVEIGRTPRLIITVPPRHWKSSLGSVKFPAWYLGKHNTHAIIEASYSASLSETFSTEIRDTIKTNPRYKALFPDVKLLTKNVDDWSLRTSVRSAFRAVGVGGGTTGHGANGIIIDDPIADYEAAQSATQRENLWNWYRSVLRTRLEPGGWIVLILTHWHEDDLAGRLLKAEVDDGGEHWEYLNLPAHNDDYDIDRTNVEQEQISDKHSNGNDVDGVSGLSEWLWEDRFSSDEYLAIQASVGPYAWNALYQGRPKPVEGNLIKEAWFEYVDALPDKVTWKVRAWDFAFTEKQTQKDDPDYTATVCGVVHQDILYLGKPRLFRKNITDTADELVTSKYEEMDIRYGVGAVAIKATLLTAMSMAGLPIESFKELGDKLQRATGWINNASVGRVVLVGDKKEWEQFMAQWTAFPTAAHDDAVDAVSGVAAMLGFVFMTPEKMRVRPLGAWNDAYRKAYGLG